MIPSWKAADDGLRYRLGIQLDMRNRNEFVVVPMIEVDRNTIGKLIAEFVSRFDVVARPTSFAYKGRSYEKDTAQIEMGWIGGDSVDQNRGANRMADQDSAFFQAHEFLFERLLPGQIG